MRGLSAGTPIGTASQAVPCRDSPEPLFGTAMAACGRCSCSGARCRVWASDFHCSFRAVRLVVTAQHLASGCVQVHAIQCPRAGRVPQQLFGFDRAADQKESLEQPMQASAATGRLRPYRLSGVGEHPIQNLEIDRFDHVDSKACVPRLAFAGRAIPSRCMRRCPLRQPGEESRGPAAACAALPLHPQPLGQLMQVARVNLQQPRRRRPISFRPFQCQPQLLPLTGLQRPFQRLQRGSRRRCGNA